MTTMLGPKAGRALEQIKFQDVMDKSIDPSTGKLNLTTFLGQMEKIENSPQAGVMKNSLDAVRGLSNLIMKPNVESAKQRAASPMASNLIQYGAGLGAAGLVGAAGATGGLLPALGAAAGVLIAPKVLSTISASSPLKSTLIGINKFIDNPGASQYFLNRAADQLGKVGITVTNDADGNVHLDKQEKSKKDLLKLSLDDNQDGVIPGLVRIPRNIPSTPAAPTLPNKLLG